MILMGPMGLTGLMGRSHESHLSHPYLSKGLTVCCPEGTNDRSQAIYCLEHVQSRIRPVGHGLIPTLGLFIALIVSTPIGPNHTVPSGTVPFFARIPGNKLPGYHHSVPPGQRRSAPIRPIAVSPIRRFASLRDGSCFRTDTRQ